MLKHIFRRFIPQPKPAPARQFAASPVSDTNITQGTDWNAVYRDRYNYQRDTVMAQALLAWRLNPLARRICNLTKQYVIDGIDFDAADERTKKFLQSFWNHPLNRIGQHLDEWCDELTLTGNLFLLITTDRSGMSYLRVYPTDQIKEINTAANDIQQETGYIPKSALTDMDPKPIPNYWSLALSGAQRSRRAKTVMLHYSVNKLAGMKWGEPDIAPMLPWLARYASWLEDRVRLNRFRQAFLYVVKGQFLNQSEKDARQRQLLANPPQPGSILVTDSSEEWDVLAPKLDSYEAATDGLAVKKFIAAGQGFPLHWLAEPESSTRTTAEAAGTPTFKSLEERQKFFMSMVQDVLMIVIARSPLGPAPLTDGINVRASDISERDNAALALASNQMVTAFGQLWANGFIDADEYLRVVYRFAGEVLPAQRPDNPAGTKSTPAGKSGPNAGAAGAANIKVDANTGDVSVKEPKV